ncbi:MAG: hypothetical protein J3K34DRAFT_524807 [Monoraphidium minutum]|nr:MAG: hypothetical protein J3K34DRAFT_524807 [Monoraphidium minutum]
MRPSWACKVHSTCHGTTRPSGAPTARRAAWARLIVRANGAGTPTRPGPLELPGADSSPAQVAAWCAAAFAQETAPSRPDAAIALTKAALLLALEEEAAAAAAQHAPQPGDARAAHGAPAAARTSGGAATWSLARLDALAADALRHFAEQHGGDAAAAPPGGGAPAAPAAERRAPLPADQAAAPPAPLGLGGLAARMQGGLVRLLGQAPPGGAAQAPGAAAAPRAAGPSGGGADEEALPHDGVRPASPLDASGAAPMAATEGGGGGPDSLRALVRRFPLAALGSVNTVLFQDQGYTACNRWGEPSDAHLSSVLERGAGGCAALTVLYAAVCARVGLDLAYHVLRDEAGSTYCVAWPASGPPAAPGVGRCCVDVYGRGALLTVEEVCELFALPPESLLAPSSRRQLLAALLADLIDAHWAAACGCAAAPVVRLPLAPATALQGRVTRLEGGPLARAAAAAAKRVALLPHSQEARLQLGLLHYFGGDYEDAWLELGILLERAAPPPPPAAAEGGTSGGGAAAATMEGAPGEGAAAAAAAAPCVAEEDVLPACVLADARVLFDKLALELLVKVALIAKGLVWESLPAKPCGGAAAGGDEASAAAAAGFRARAPLGKIPALMVMGGGGGGGGGAAGEAGSEAGAAVLYESEVILEWLEDAFPHPPLLPADPLARAQARLVSRFHDLYLEPALRRLYPLVGPSPDAGAAAAAAGDFCARLRQLEAILAAGPGGGGGGSSSVGSPGAEDGGGTSSVGGGGGGGGAPAYAVGGRLTLADCVYPGLFHYADVIWPALGLPPLDYAGLPHVAAWRDALRRDAAAAAVLRELEPAAREWVDSKMGRP